MMNEYGQNTKKRMSTGKKVAIGCGSVFLLFVIVIVVGIWYVVSMFKGYTQPFIDKGYAQVGGQGIMVTQPVTTPTIFVGQGVTIDANCDADIAFAAQIINVRSVIKGDVDIAFAQTFTLEDGAKIEGDLRVKTAQIITIASGAEVTGNIEVEGAQFVVIEDGATVGGTVSGNYQELQQDPGAIVGSSEEGGNGGERDTGGGGGDSGGGGGG